nr:vicilin-like seed storage protein At2g18540 [Coffea arabica]
MKERLRAEGEKKRAGEKREWKQSRNKLRDKGFAEEQEEKLGKKREPRVRESYGLRALREKKFRGAGRERTERKKEARGAAERRKQERKREILVRKKGEASGKLKKKENEGSAASAEKKTGKRGSLGLRKTKQEKPPLEEGTERSEKEQGKEEKEDPRLKIQAQVSSSESAVDLFIKPRLKVQVQRR